MDSGIQMFTTDSVSTISSGKIVAQTSTFEQTSMTDDDPGIRIIGDNKVELVYKNKVTNEEASIDLYNSNNSSNNAKLYIDNPRGTTSLIIDQNRRLGVGNIVPEAILHLHNHNNSNSEHIRVTNNDNLGMNMILTSSNTDIKANFGIRWYNSGSTTLVNNALVIRNLNGTNTIGIGTSTPSYTLDVSGNINFTGTLTQNGSTYTGSYTLPTASSSTLGGIKIGNNLSINGSGVLSATDTDTTYSVGDGGLTQNNFTNTLKTKLDGIASSANNYSLPAATSSSLGGIKVGTGLSINSGTGVLSTNITSVGTLSSLTVSGDATFDTSVLKVDSSNNRVGIGTSSPLSGLQVINDNGLTVSGTATSGTRTGVLRLGSPYTANHDAYCAKITSTNNHSSNYNSDLRFFTSIGDNQNATERMCILSSGNVGIGTSSPATKLHVAGDGNILNLQGTVRPSIFFYKGDTSGGTLKWVCGMNTTTNENFTIDSYEGNDDLLLNPSGGNVGIGNTNPSYKLDVSGNINFTGTLTQNGSTYPSNSVTTSGDQSISGTKTFTGSFIPPKLTSTQRDALTAVSGMMIYNTTTDKHQGYNGSSWSDFY